MSEKKALNEDIEFLKELQKELKTQEIDCQASPRFWVIMDYRSVPANKDYDSGEYEHFHNDGDQTIFRNYGELKDFIEEYFEDEVEIDEDLKELLTDQNESFHELWEYIENNLNGEGYFDKCFVKEESFIVPDTMFISKEDAKRHLELNNYHYTAKAHTYAMTAWRSPKVERLFSILETMNWDML